MDRVNGFEVPFFIVEEEWMFSVEMEEELCRVIWKVVNSEGIFKFCVFSAE